jgi:hypothetical protein
MALSALAIAVMLALFLTQAHQAAGSLDGASGPLAASPAHISVTDALLFIHRGMRVFVPSPTERFEIPVLWIIQPVTIALLVGGYPSEGLSSTALQALVRSKGRVTWWLSKCAWVAIAATAWHALCIAMAAAACALFGGAAFELSAGLSAAITGLDAGLLDPSRLAWALAAALAVSVALSLSQTLLSFLLGRAKAYVLLMCYIVASIYYFTPLLMADMAMLERSSLFCPGGYDSAATVAACAAASIAVTAAGALCFHKRDLLGRS